MKSVRIKETRKKLQPIFSNKKQKNIIQEPKIISCWVSKEKLTVELEDHREISVLISWLASRWFFLEELKAEQLKNYKIWGGGYTLLFPDIDESVPVGVFTEGENYSC